MWAALDIEHGQTTTASGPLLPLDGGRILVSLLPDRIGRPLSRLEPYGLIILVVLLFSGVLGSILWPIIVFFETLVAVPFGLTDIINGVQRLVFS